MLIRCICTENRFQHEVRMQRAVGLFAGMGLAFIIFGAPPARAAEMSGHIRAIRAVSMRSAGPARAWVKAAGVNRVGLARPAEQVYRCDSMPVRFSGGGNMPRSNSICRHDPSPSAAVISMSRVTRLV